MDGLILQNKMSMLTQNACAIDLIVFGRSNQSAGFSQSHYRHTS